MICLQDLKIDFTHVLLAVTSLKSTPSSFAIDLYIM